MTVAPPSTPTTTSLSKWAADVALTMFLFLFLNVMLARGLGQTGPEWLAGAVMVLATVLRRYYPLVMLAIVTLAGVAMVALSQLMGNWNLVQPPLLVVPLVAYSVARRVPSRASRSVLAIGALASIFAGLLYGPHYSNYASSSATLISVVVIIVVCGGLVVTPYAIGRRVLESARLREQRNAAAAERAQHSVATQEQRIRISEAASRAQIARELHDIVAHSLSVIIVQAEGGRALATKKPEAAAEVLGTIAESGREALGEMRRIVSVLRGTPTMSAEYAPTPGLDDIADLVTKSGADASLEVDGVAPAVPQTLGLTAYRVVQEALTNVLRHAGSEAHASVRLSYSPNLVVVEVADDGRGAASSIDSDGEGNGLRGMRERVSSMGGQLVARPRPGGGFEVRALLPIVSPPVYPMAPPSGPPVPAHLAPAVPVFGSIPRV